MDLQKKSFIEPSKICPHWLKTILWKELGHLVQKYRIAILKNISLVCCQTLFSDFISDLGVTDHRHYDQ